jgi:hypothetical protein
MSSEENKKPYVEKIEIDRKWLESIVELDLCGPVKEKIGRDACKPDIVVTPCKPSEVRCFPFCWPMEPHIACMPKTCLPDTICYPTFHQPCFPECAPFCAPIVICPPIYRGIPKGPDLCGPSVELPVDRLDEIAKVVKELKNEIAEMKKKIERK